MIFTDSRGQFFARKRKGGRYQLEVVTDQFLVPGRFEVVSAPSVVNAVLDDAATEITIILRQLRPAPN